MNTNTHTLTINANYDRVFAFLSKVENLPKWAKVFCKELKTDENNNYKVVTSEGEIFFKIDADCQTGVIDMYGGPTENQMAYWPARVVRLSENACLFIFTNIQYPGVPDESFAQQCEGLKQEFSQISDILEN